MKSSPFFLFINIILTMNLALNAQVQTVTLQPGPADGMDALIRDDFPSTSYGNDVNFTSNAWTVGGNPCILRSLLRFDLSTIPASATIQNATLSMYCNINSGIYQLQSGDNASYLLRITENWDETTVTWITQPTTSFQNAVLLPASASTMQDYPEIDVTLAVQEMVSNPSGNHGWMLKLVTEELYRSMVFASSDHPFSSWRPKLVVTYSDCLNPVARFNYQATGTMVNFSDSSSSATSWYWSFGDGYYSDLRNPVHSYAQPGKYKTCLVVQDSCGSDEFCDTVYACESPVTRFSFSITDQMVKFSDLSFQATSWYWSFGDGFYSDLQNPLHFFNDYGIYYVCLISGNNCRQETFCDSVEVKHPSGIADESFGNMGIYPNPANDFISINLSKEHANHTLTFEILDQNCRIMKTGFAFSQSGPGKIDISDLSKGFYYFRLITDKRVMVRKFLVCR